MNSFVFQQRARSREFGVALIALERVVAGVCAVVTVQFTFGHEGRRAVLVGALEWLDLRVTTEVLLEIRVLRESAAANRAHIRFVSLKIFRRT